jgi:hypothetical protein
MMRKKFEIIFERLKDIFLFREGNDIDNILVPPTVTTGSVIWGLLFRSALIIIPSMIVIIAFNKREFWWISAFLFWFFAVYPAYRQYSKFQERIKKIKDDTLCGKCKYFLVESQLCSILDEHIGNNTIPCEGESWEPTPDFFD